MTNNLIRKITLSAMFIAIGLILERVIMIPLGEVNRIAFGSSAVILASLIVGPLFGMVVGASVDVIGFMLNSVGTFTPFVTIGYMVLGSLPYFLVQIWMRLRKFSWIYALGFVLLSSFIVYGLWFIYSRDFYNFTLGFNPDGSPRIAVIDLTTPFVRYIAPILSTLIFIGFYVSMFVISKKVTLSKEKTQPTILELMFTVLIVEFLISIVWGVQWRLWYFNIPQTSNTAYVFYFNQIMFFVIAFPVKTLIVAYGFRTYQQYQKIVR
jgi:ECF transporter S component (folate family)